MRLRNTTVWNGAKMHLEWKIPVNVLRPSRNGITTLTLEITFLFQVYSSLFLFLLSQKKIFYGKLILAQTLNDHTKELQFPTARLCYVQYIFVK